MSDPVFKRIFNLVYPVGSIYMSVNSTSPATLFGGTWTQIKGRFLLGTGVPDSNTDSYFGSMSGTQYNAGAASKGGQDYHTLTVSEMPSHTHKTDYNETAAIGRWEWEANSSTIAANDNQNGYRIRGIGNTGGGAKHNNMPPYFAVNIWQRTA